jgi:hypothetical protein
MNTALATVARDWAKDLLEPNLFALEPLIEVPVTLRALRFMTTIAGQESAWKHRHQVGGPAHGNFQFEKHGGCKEIMLNKRTRPRIQKVFEHVGEEFELNNAFALIETHDLIMVAFARLLVWQDPAPLPIMSVQAWNYYIRNWRPGKPHPKSWRGLWDIAGSIYPDDRTGPVMADRRVVKA